MLDAGYTVNQPKKKHINKPQYFIIKFPNFAESLIKCPNGWIGLNDYIKYFKDEYDDNIIAIAISKREARKFVRKGELFHVNK
jgi:hypothetical protein